MMKRQKPFILFILFCFWMFLPAACQADNVTPSPTPAPSPTSEVIPSPASTQPTLQEYTLADSGPWVLFSAENGLWAMNEDGSALTQLTTERVISPSDLKTGHSFGNSYFAYITASDMSTLQGLKLNIVTLPDGKVKTITALASAETEPLPNAEICEPKYEAARAVTMDNSIEWSPDGNQIAFIGSMQGNSADVYVYSLQDESIVRVSDEPGQAYDLHWHWLPESKTIVYFSASCFGTGAGFNMEGAWAVDTKTSKTEKIYEPSVESWGEKFIAWSRSGAESFFVSTISGCPQRDLRLVDIPSKEVKPIFKDCFEDYAVGPTSSLAVLTSADFSEQPGLYIYGEPDIISIPPVYAPESNGRQVRYLGSQFFVSIAGQDSMEIRSFNWDGSAGWYQGKGDFLVVSADEQTWAWNENETFHLNGKGSNTSIILSSSPGLYALWNEDLGITGEIRQRLYFFSGADGDELYIASNPDYLPVLVAKELKPLSAPIIMFSPDVTLQ